MSVELDKIPGAESLLAVKPKVAAELLGIGLRTIRRELAAGRLASYRVGRCVCIRLADVRAYQDQNMQRGCV